MSARAEAENGVRARRGVGNDPPLGPRREDAGAEEGRLAHADGPITASSFRARIRSQQRLHLGLAAEEDRRVLLREAREPRVRASAPRPPAGPPTRRRCEHRLERQRQVVRSLEALLPPLLQAPPHDPVHRRRDRRVQAHERRRRLLQDRGQRRRHRLAPERVLAAPGARRAPPRTRRGPTARPPAAPAPAPGTCRPPSPSARPASSGSTPSAPRCRAPAAVSLARPKSRILMRPSVVRKRFSGLRSRWTMPLRWAAARPWAAWTAQARTWRWVGERRDEDLAERSRPRAARRRRRGCRRRTPTSWTVRMWGWLGGGRACSATRSRPRACAREPGGSSRPRCRRSRRDSAGCTRRAAATP